MNRKIIQSFRKIFNFNWISRAADFFDTLKHAIQRPEVTLYIDPFTYVDYTQTTRPPISTTPPPISTASRIDFSLLLFFFLS